MIKTDGMINKEMIDFVTERREGDKIDVTNLWEFLALHEKLVLQDERKRVKTLFAETVSSGTIQFLLDIDVK
jgi:hypothetical protein